MKLLIFGSTGELGKVLVEQALEEGHEVTAFARTPSKITIQNPHLHIFAGDATNQAKVNEAVKQQDVVLSALGTKDLKQSNVISTTVKNIIYAMEKEHINRLIFTSAFGVGDSFKEGSFIQKIGFMTVVKNIYADKKIQEKLITNSKLNWTILRPMTLTTGPKTETYRVGEHIRKGLFPTISRADVADFMIKLLNDSKYNKKIVQISY